MVSEGTNMTIFEPYLVLISGAILSLLVLVINLMGDGRRDVTTPEGSS